jgi:hypothetical protein
VVFHALKGTIVGVVFISTSAFISSLPLLSLLHAHIVRPTVIIKVPSLKKFLPCPLSRSSARSTSFSFFFLPCTAVLDVSLMFPYCPGWVGVLAGSQIGEFKLEATLCCHSTVDFPNNAFLCVVLSQFSVPVFGLWDNFPCHLFAVACSARDAPRCHGCCTWDHLWGDGRCFVILFSHIVRLVDLKDVCALHGLVFVYGELWLLVLLRHTCDPLVLLLLLYNSHP